MLTDGRRFTFPVNGSDLPLATGDETKGNGHIEIKKYGLASTNTPPLDLIDDDEEASIMTATQMTITTPTKAEMQPRVLSPSTDSNQQISLPSTEPMPFEQALDRFVWTNNPESSEEKVWPHPLHSTEKDRGTNWIKAKAAEREAKAAERDAKAAELMEEAEQGTEMAVADAIEEVANVDYENAAETDEILGGIGMDGFTKLADWMSAGGPLGRDATVRSPLP